MQITEDSITGKDVIFESIIDEISGGASLDLTRLDYTEHNDNVDKRYIKAGAPVYFAPGTRIAELCKSAVGIDGGTSTAIRVGKNHHFAVGEFINDGTTSGLISAIATTEDDYDTITVNTALVYAEDTKFCEGTLTGASTALLYTPNGVVKADAYMGDGNADVSIVTIGTVREDALSYVVPTLYKIALRGGVAGTGTSLITFTSEDN